MNALRQLLNLFRRDRRGAVAVVTAVAILGLIGFTAAAVDFGSVFLKTRQLQGIADLAAAAAATNMDSAQAAANATVAANNWGSPVSAAVETGTYSGDPNVPPADRFSPGGASPNAVRVTLSSTADLYFASVLMGRSNIAISRTATAAQGNLASFSLGSRLAGLQGGLANTLLSALTGSSVSLSVMDYNALASAQIDLFQYVSALKTRANVTGGSFDQTLTGNVKTSDALTAIGDVLTAQGNSGVATAAMKIASAANQTPISLGNLMDLGPYGGQDYVNLSGSSGAMVSALDLASAVLQLSQGGRQVQFNLNLGVPGISSAKAWLAIGQRPVNSPWIAITNRNTVIVRTAQARLYIDAKVVAAAPLLSIDVPIFVEMASAQAKLSSISCQEPGAGNSVTVSVAPSVGKAAIGQVNTDDLNNFEEELPIASATMVSLPLISITGSSEADIGGGDWQDVAFGESDISSGAIKTVKTRDIAATTFSTLLGNLNLTVHILGLGLGLDQNALKSAVQTTLQGVATPLDGAVDGMTDLLGLGLGEADVRVNGVRCKVAALVQ